MNQINLVCWRKGRECFVLMLCTCGFWLLGEGGVSVLDFCAYSLDSMWKGLLSCR